MIQKLQDLKLGTKLFLGFLLVTIISVGIVTFFNDRETRSFFTKRVGNELKNISTSQALALGDLLISQLDLLRSFSLNQAFISEVSSANSAYHGDIAFIQSQIEQLDQQWRDAPDNSELIQSRLINTAAEELVKLHNNFPDHVEIFITDMYGALVASTGRTSDYNQADEGWWQAAYNNGTGALFIAEPEFDESSQVLSINMAVPIFDRDQKKVIGILRTTYNMAGLDKMINRASLGESGYIDLWLPGDQVFHAKINTLEAGDADTIQALNAISEDYADITYNGTRSIVSRVKVTSSKEDQIISNLGWFLVTTQEREEILKPINQTTQQSLLVSVVAFILALVIGYIFTAWIRTPILKLITAAQQVSTGDLNVGIEVNTRDEIGQALQAFKEMINYLQNMAHIARQIANGDLTVSITPQSENDELSNAFSQMIHNLRHLLGQLIDHANSLSSASIQLVSSANQAGLATAQIATTIQQVAKGTTEQSQAVTKTAASVDQMSQAIDGVAKGAQEQSRAVGQASNVTSKITNAIQQVAENAKSSAVAATQASATAQNGVKTVEETIKGMDNIKAKVGLSAQKVQEMGQHSQQIGAIIETIEDIAAQTNLLALNAAIEAARAGEYGKGFAVVADEVRKLAERAGAATKEISGLIQGIQHTVTEAVAAMQQGATEVELGASQASVAGQALTEILEAVEVVNQQVDAISLAAQHIAESSNELVSAMDSVSAVVEENTAATEQIAASSSEFSHAIENIASVNEENSAAVEEVAASAEEVSAQVEEVNSAAQSLNNLAQALRELATQFQLTT
ncbi:MAG: methyl-accepting chemotaxis protein [Chloroflexota bacterium]